MVQETLNVVNTGEGSVNFTEITEGDANITLHTDNLFLYSVYDLHIYIKDGQVITHDEDVYGRTTTTYDPTTKIFTLTKSGSGNLGYYGAYTDLG